MPVEFRKLPKRSLGGRIPDDLEAAVRALAHAQRRSISSVLTELIARGLDQDPRTYGVGSRSSRPAPLPIST